MDKQTSITIDGIKYNVKITQIKINGEFLYKYAERVTSGDLLAEGIGFFENQSIVIEGDQDNDFKSLYQKLKKLEDDGTFNKTVQTFSPLEDYNQLMYPDKLSVPMIRLEYDESNNIKAWWGEMTVKFIAVQKRGQ